MKVEVGVGYLLTKWLNMYLKLKKGNGLYMCYHVTWNCYNADDSFLFNFNHLMCYNFVKKKVYFVSDFGTFTCDFNSIKN